MGKDGLVKFAMLKLNIGKLGDIPGNPSIDGIKFGWLWGRGVGLMRWCLESLQSSSSEVEAVEALLKPDSGDPSMWGVAGFVDELPPLWGDSESLTMRHRFLRLQCLHHWSVLFTPNLARHFFDSMFSEKKKIREFYRYEMKNILWGFHLEMILCIFQILFLTNYYVTLILVLMLTR